MPDKLFLLKPDFEDGGEFRYYCPECAQLEGVLSFYPQLRRELEVQYVDFLRPRKPIAELIGEANQGAPVLILGRASSRPAGLEFGQDGHHYFVAGANAIGQYLAKQYHLGWPHQQTGLIGGMSGWLALTWGPHAAGGNNSREHLGRSA